MPGRRSSSLHLVAVSSYVADGGVGLRAVMAMAQSLGVAVTAIPSVVLSNHLGYGASAAQHVPAETLSAMADALAANGAFDRVDGCLTGYLPSATHAGFAADMIDRIKERNPGCVTLVDPVIGDDPGGVYIDPAAAAAIKSMLIDRADVITPNRFELSFLSGADVSDTQSAIEAARGFAAGRPLTIAATSIPAGPQHVSNIIVRGTAVSRATAPLITEAPHGTGDLFASALLLSMLHGNDAAEALRHATASVRYVLQQSGGRRELALHRIDAGMAARITQSVETLA